MLLVLSYSWSETSPYQSEDLLTVRHMVYSCLVVDYMWLWVVIGGYMRLWVVICGCIGLYDIVVIMVIGDYISLCVVIGGLTVVTSGYMGVMVHKLPKLEGAPNGKGGLRLSLVPRPSGRREK